jgi:hypothetical protein
MPRPRRKPIRQKLKLRSPRKQRNSSLAFHEGSCAVPAPGVPREQLDYGDDPYEVLDWHPLLGFDRAFQLSSEWYGTHRDSKNMRALTL